MENRRIQLVYDNECPACTYYARLARIRESVGELELIDARDDTDVRREITALGLDLDEGMVLRMDDTLYYGSDAIHMLSLLSTRSGFFNRLTFWMFRSKRLAGVLYPVLRAMRNLLLKTLGRTRINNLGLDDNDRF